MASCHFSKLKGSARHVGGISVQHGISHAKSMICFSNTELDWLEIRQDELWDEVNYFVIVEAATTFQEGTKPLCLLDNWSQFQPIHSKMIHHVANMTGANLPPGDSWEHERYIRNALFDQALVSLSGNQAPTKGDVLLVSDVDEVPRISTLQVLRNCAYPPPVTLRSQFYYYSFQWQHRGEQWAHPQATYCNGVTSTIRPEDLRNGIPDREILNAGWHCSSCMPSLNNIVTKITSFSHKGYNQPYFTHRGRLLNAVSYGLDIFERPKETYDRIDDNPDVPTYLKQKEAREKFAYTLNRDPMSANIQDADR
jgi:beta-1,4-mannosyl-glycoprotein beta-1,4-N-acetylglucosaminyltransferase